MTGRKTSSREPLILLALTGLVLIGSGIRPFDRATWWMEVAPVLIGAPVLVATFSRSAARFRRCSCWRAPTTGRRDRSWAIESFRQPDAAAVVLAHRTSAPPSR